MDKAVTGSFDSGAAVESGSMLRRLKPAFNAIMGAFRKVAARKKPVVIETAITPVTQARDIVARALDSALKAYSPEKYKNPSLRAGAVLGAVSDNLRAEMAGRPYGVVFANVSAVRQDIDVAINTGCIENQTRSLSAVAAFVNDNASAPIPKI